jgi:hypothetical protein
MKKTAALLLATPAMAVSDVTGMTSDRYVSMFNDRLGGVAHAKPKPGAAHEPKDCAAIRAFNEKAPSMAGMEPLPCHCIPASERGQGLRKTAARVYMRQSRFLRQGVPSWAHMF